MPRGRLRGQAGRARGVACDRIDRPPSPPLQEDDVTEPVTGGRRYQRVLLKLSGEVFGGGQVGLAPTSSRGIAEQIADRRARGHRRSPSSSAAATSSAAPSSQQQGMDRTRADYMGMLGTVMNCLALQDFLEKAGHRDPRPDGHHDGPGRRAVHPAAGRSATSRRAGSSSSAPAPACRSSPPTRSRPSAPWRSSATRC